MSTIVIPNDFTAGTPIVAADVNTNFTAIETWSGSAVHNDEANAFTVVPTLPTAVGPALGAVHKTYVDDRFKSDSGIQIGSATATPTLTTVNTVVATVTSGTAIPLNTANPTVLLLAHADIELVGNVGMTAGSFAMNLEFSWDNGATWVAGGQTNGNTVLSGGRAYGGMSLTGFVYSNPASAQIVQVRLSAVNRDGTIGTIHVGTVRLTLQVTRQVSLA